LDSIGAIYEPLVKISPELSVYFMLAILVVGIVLMNMILGVIVNTAMDLAKADHAYLEQMDSQRRKKLIRDMRQVFLRLDEDQSGKITLEELESLDQMDRRKLERILNVAELELEELFSALDVDGSNELEIDEFCDGIWQVSISHVPVETKRMENTLCLMRDQLKDLSRRHNLTMDRQVVQSEALRDIRFLLEALQVEVPGQTSSNGCVSFTT
jgi:hypothetical protein